MRYVGDEEFAKRVISFYVNLAERSKIKTVKHFQNEGKDKGSVYRIIRRYEATNIVGHRKSTGRTTTVGTPKMKQKISKLFLKHPSTSVSAAAKKLDINRSTLSHIKVRKLGIKAYTKKKAPKYVKDQEQRAKSGCRFVYKKTLQKILIIDDETYLPWDPQDVPGKKFFHATDPNEVTYSEKVQPKAKFFKKTLIWQAMDENGNISEPFVSEGTISAEVYLKECIQARLLPFIDKYYDRNQILFWPDMASAHYANKVTSFLNDSNIEFVQKSKNAPNVPQARGIERFWALCKAEYSKRQNPPKSLRGLASVWRNISKSVAEKSGKAVMDRALTNLRNIGYKGVEGSELS